MPSQAARTLPDLGISHAHSSRPLTHLQCARRVVSITEGGKECFSVVVATDGASERRLPMRFNTRADAEETVAYLKRSIARWPSSRGAVTTRYGRTSGSS